MHVRRRSALDMYEKIITDLRQAYDARAADRDDVARGCPKNLNFEK